MPTTRNASNPLTGTFLLCAFFALFLAHTAHGNEASQAGSGDNRRGAVDVIEEMMAEHFLVEAKQVIGYETWRDAEGGNEAEERALDGLRHMRDYLIERAEAFNATQQELKLRPFEWRSAPEDNGGKQYWVFGFRLGSGEQKRALMTHGDTVGPGDPSWKPFEARIEKRMFRGKSRDFLVGRGATDDKGATIVAFNVLKAIAKRLDGQNALDDWTLELVIDSSEESGMSTPHYLKDPNTRAPSFGIVFDAVWTVRAEKGSERPTFRVENSQERRGIWVESLEITPGPTNQIPDYAIARFEGASKTELAAFADSVVRRYETCPFDDPEYRRAELSVSSDDGAVLLRANVRGAQHGSAPGENRAEGANPLVSLLNFIAHLADDETISKNGIARMSQFVAWAWGTQVFGEHHPDLLLRHDEVFSEGNGTTYAVTRFSADDAAVTLGVDIRYALGHNDTPWDGHTEGLLPGKSTFSTAFSELLARFQRAHPGPEIIVNTRTGNTPDVRNPDNPQLLRLKEVYEKVAGPEYPFTLHAIGGGTDAKGHPELIAAGPMLNRVMGPPVNLHGINEAVPMEHLALSAKILYLLLLEEVLGL